MLLLLSAATAMMVWIQPPLLNIFTPVLTALTAKVQQWVQQPSLDIVTSAVTATMAQVQLNKKKLTPCYCNNPSYNINLFITVWLFNSSYLNNPFDELTNITDIPVEY